MDANRGAALGFAGEKGGVASDPGSGLLVAFDGELFVGRPVTGTEAAQTVLAGWLEHGARWRPPDGWFAAAVWDPRTGTLGLVTDHMGHVPLYVAQTAGTTIVAGELKALVAAGLDPALDPQAWAEMLAYEHPLGEHAPLAGVRALPAATTLVLQKDGTEQRWRWWRYLVEPAADGDVRELADEVARLLGRAVVERLEPASGLALSGGLDSRSLATVVAAYAPETLALTWGAPGSEDLRYGAEIARLSGLPHRSCPLEPGYMAAGAAETVWLGEGHVRCLHAHHLVVRPFRSRVGLRSLVIGFGGDPVLRDFKFSLLPRLSEDAFAHAFHAQRAGCISDDLLEQIFMPRFAAELRGRARESLARHLAEEPGARYSRVLQFIWNHNHRRKVLPAAWLFRDDLPPRDPFDDPELIELGRRMSTALRRAGQLQCHYLRRFPALASVRSPKDGLPPALTGRRRRLAAFRVKAQRRFRAEAEGRVGLRRLPDHRGLGDYATELRGGSSALLDVLLEQRTLARGQLREETVRRLLSDTQRGRARHTRALGMLLTLELFQRQFLDGDGLTAEEP